MVTRFFKVSSDVIIRIISIVADFIINIFKATKKDDSPDDPK